MTNKRYFVPPDYQNESFTKDEIILWNNYLKDNYRIWLRFRDECRNKIAAKVKYLSARDMVSKIRMEKHWKIINAVSPFLAFMFCTRYPEHQDKFKRVKRKAVV